VRGGCGGGVGVGGVLFGGGGGGCIGGRWGRGGGGLTAGVGGWGLLGGGWSKGECVWGVFGGGGVLAWWSTGEGKPHPQTKNKKPPQNTQHQGPKTQAQKKTTPPKTKTNWW